MIKRKRLQSLQNCRLERTAITIQAKCNQPRPGSLSVEEKVVKETLHWCWLGLVCETGLRDWFATLKPSTDTVQLMPSKKTKEKLKAHTHRNELLAIS